MVCNKKTNIKKSWIRYCTFINKLPRIKNDTVLGVYLGCACKNHDIRYSKEGISSRKITDYIFMKDIQREFKKEDKKNLGYLISFIFWIVVRISGWFFWKTWSIKGVERYL